ncbi:glycoside hydrolase family 55 protein [Xylona heveae TC161]|uniref:Glycoside hydrolase family 55 protein n=1 Tax=Xylona heveae (strain CBS 132557 / TC161) TaxID=1328760 RepID=A0A161TPJ0_XYLHT|nr:glycoside hydrolase family 55 protein [Xylona heveae TC161]KZF24126.1 glycoside hydrolase family 55 protein [Xylona heveae TC161]
MATFFTITLFVALRCLLFLTGPTRLVEALPAADVSNSTAKASTNATTHSLLAQAASSSNYWVANIQRQGTVAYSGGSSYPIYRNVMDYGAKGDGSTDDTNAINLAISTGNRCGHGCDSSTVTPAIVYFPPGTYIVSSPIIQYYYTQFIGDALNIPTIKAAATFSGIAVIDADPYDNTGNNWYTNQNNFFRQIRNFVIDLTQMPPSSGAGIHWQIAQATSLQNIRFEMVRGGSNNKQQGIFMDNGSGGFMTDLVFNGGNYGAFFGNQQFTTRNLTFNGCNTAIYLNWDWVWTMKSLSINNCGIGIDMTSGGASNPGVGSLIVQDSTFTNTPIGIKTVWGPSTTPTSAGTLVIDNVDFVGSGSAVSDGSGNTILAGGTLIAEWIQGRKYVGNGSGSRIQSTVSAPSKPGVLLDGQGRFFERSKPQYEEYSADSFVSVKSKGAKGDGTTDDTAAIQAVFDSLTSCDIVYFDHGAYVISNTVFIPANVKITGEIWPLIMAQGSAFQDQNNPKPVFQVGNPGDVGSVEISDLIFETVGPQPGAILMEWNVAQSSPGSVGLWDVHFRIGGSAGTDLESNTCTKDPSVIQPANPSCMAAFLALYVSPSGTIYLENNWFWTADHELDLGDHSQINVFNGRGVLIESSNGPVWAYGTSSEHHQLYCYEVANAKNIYLGAIQTETPYYQSNPNALTPFTPQTSWQDPTFSDCTDDSCRKSWSLRITDSSDVFVYGAGLYSFFENYDQTCLQPETCQTNIVSIEGSSSDVWLFALTTIASTYMVTLDGTGVVLGLDNKDTFAQSIAEYSLS